ncbi:MAG: 50S ribosomal protein L21 [Anaerolineales bacterium]|nr:50S ribosomal protein L21 [Anaerolineales bacterium]
MKFAIVESGGKQYRAVEGRTIDVDRLAMEKGAQYNIDRVLLLADGDDVMVGTPTVDGVEVKVTVAEHFRGPKLITFKYRPKKRIRVKSGHRQQYTRLMVDSIGKPGKSRKKEEKPVVEKKETKAKAATKVKTEADDLTKIEGIGPKVSKTLQAAGISTFKALAKAKSDDIQEILNEAGLAMMDASTWPQQAKLAAKGDWDGMEKLQDELSGGRKVKPAKKSGKK